MQLSKHHQHSYSQNQVTQPWSMDAAKHVTAALTAWCCGLHTFWQAVRVWIRILYQRYREADSLADSETSLSPPRSTNFIHSTTPAPTKAPTKLPNPIPTLPAPPVKVSTLVPPGVSPVPVALGPTLLYTPVLPTAEYTPVAVG